MAESGEGKTRRRFLADLLFLGGGLTAAAFLAENWRTPTPATSPSATPNIAVDGPNEIPTPAPPLPHPEGEMAIPDGDYVQSPPPEPPSQPPAVKGEAVAPQACPAPPPEPAIEGRRAAPKQD